MHREGFSENRCAARIDCALLLNSQRPEAAMIFGLGMQELLVIFIVVLFIFGAKRLPEIGSAFGKSLREFKKATNKEKDGVSTWIKSPTQVEEGAHSSTRASEQEDNVLKRELEHLPGVKEAQEIKETARKIKAAGRVFFKK
jgi:sec-independent protein translocase protein TatA